MKGDTMSNRVYYDEDVNYDSLEQHIYPDQPDYVFYTCPRCFGEYLSTFIIEESGSTMCVECADKLKFYRN